jgi:hypothetical protein
MSIGVIQARGRADASTGHAWRLGIELISTATRGATFAPHLPHGSDGAPAGGRSRLRRSEASIGSLEPLSAAMRLTPSGPRPSCTSEFMRPGAVIKTRLPSLAGSEARRAVLHPWPRASPARDGRELERGAHRLPSIERSSHGAQRGAVRSPCDAGISATPGACRGCRTSGIPCADKLRTRAP